MSGFANAPIALPAGALDKVDPSLMAIETLVQAALRREQFRGASEQEFWAWLRTILVRQVMDGLRRSESRGTSLEGAQADLRIASREADPATEAERSDDVSALHRAVERLSEEEREIFCLYHRSDVPKPLVAAMMGIEETTLRQRAKRARIKLKEWLEGQTPDRRAGEE